MAALLLASCTAIPGLFRWWWSRSPDPDVVSYRVEAHFVEAFHFPCQVTVCAQDCDPAVEGCCHLEDETCISYTSGLPSLASLEPQTPPDATSDVCTEWDSGGLEGTVIPTLDSVLFVNVRAVDSTGNIGG